MVQLIVNNNHYSRIVSPESILKLTNEEENQLKKIGIEKLTYLHNLLINSSASSVSFRIPSHHGYTEFTMSINDKAIYIEFPKCMVSCRAILATFKNSDKFMKVNFDVQLFSDFLQDYAVIEKNLIGMLKVVSERKEATLSKVDKVAKALGITEAIKVSVNEELESNVTISPQEETKQKVGEIHIDGQVIKIITDDEITIVKPKQKSLGSGKNGV